MRPSIKKILTLFLVLLISAALNAQKQKNIRIDEDLAANSVPERIKLGTQTFKKMGKYTFGEFQVLEGEVGWTTTTGGSNLFGTKAEYTSSNKFSFTMADKSSNTATVNAACKVRMKAKMEAELVAHFFIGEDEILLNEENFTATLFLNNDTTNLWLLIMKRSMGTESEHPGGAFLANRDRKILIISASSDYPGLKQRLLPARGYQFIEGQTTLAALQYLGAGTLGMNQCFAWIRKDLDTDTRIVLAAAITALLHKELNEMTGIDVSDE